MKYIKGNYDKSDSNKYIVAYYNCNGSWSQATFKVDEGLDPEEFRNRAMRAVLIMLGVSEVHPHRLIEQEYFSDGGLSVYYSIYLSEEEEDQVNAGQVTDAQVRALLTKSSRDTPA